MIQLKIDRQDESKGVSEGLSEKLRINFEAD